MLWHQAPSMNRDPFVAVHLRRVPPSILRATAGCDAASCRTRAAPPPRRRVRFADFPLLFSLLAVTGNAWLEDANIVHHRRAEDGYVEPWKQAEHQRKDQLHADLGRPLLGILPPLGPRHFRVRPQRLRDAGPELVGLHEHRDQRPDLVDLGPRRKVLEGLEPWLARADLGGNQPQLFG